MLAVLTGVLVVQSLYAFPYPDRFTGIPGAPYQAVERTPVLGARDFLLQFPGQSISANDVYSLPYAFDLNTRYFVQPGKAGNSTKSFDETCADPALLGTRLRQGSAEWFAYRKQMVSHLLDCPSLEQALKTFPLRYDDTYFSVYQLK